MFCKFKTVALYLKITLEIVFTLVKESAPLGTKTNIFIAAFATLQAYMKLYKSLEKVNESVLYYNTDSVIYKWKPGDPEIELGDYLGDMTNELDEDFITEFISGGAKNYGYITKNGKVCVKVCGFSLNYRGSKQLNHQVMKRNILQEIQDPLPYRRNTNVVNPCHFVCEPASKRITTVELVKKYGLVFDKHVIDRFTSYPYGYRCFANMEDVQLLLSF